MKQLELELSLSLGCNMTIIHKKKRRNKCRDGVFECRTCSKKFMSFQALGGHRAGHLRACKTVESFRLSGPSKKVVHGCHVCGLGFATGQALGGHMRGHKLVSVFESNHDASTAAVGTPSGAAGSSTLLLQLFH